MPKATELAASLKTTQADLDDPQPSLHDVLRELAKARATRGEAATSRHAFVLFTVWIVFPNVLLSIVTPLTRIYGPKRCSVETLKETVRCYIPMGENASTKPRRSVVINNHQPFPCRPTVLICAVTPTTLT